MSEMIGAQCSLLQGLAGAAGFAGAFGTSATAADGVIPEGGFGAVLGAVMADQSGDTAVMVNSDFADAASEDNVSVGVISDSAASDTAVSGKAAGTAAAGDVTAAVKPRGDTGAADVTDAANAGDPDSGASVTEALYGLVYGDMSSALTDSEAVTMERLFTVLTGNAPKADVFTGRGAGAFVSAVQRFFSPVRVQEDGSVSPMELLALWQDVSSDEKSAYADILSAIAGRSGVPGEELPVGELLSFAVKTAAGNAARLPFDRKKQESSDGADISGKAAAAYLAAAFIAPAIGMQNVPAARVEVSVEAVVSGMSGEAVSHNVPVAAALSEASVETDVSAADGSELTAGMTEKANDAAYELSAADSEDIRDFCDMLAGELKVQAENDAASENSVTPADISRQAFMARVSDPRGASFEPVAERLTAGMQAGSVQDRSQSDIRELVGNRAVPDISFPGDMAAANMVHAGIVRDNIPAGEADIPETVNAYDTNALADRIVYRTSGLGADGEESVTLRLSPEELGEIRVTVSRRAGETSVEFVARKTESAAVIGDRAAALADAMVSRGISLKEISVSDMGRNVSEDGRSGQEMSYRGDRQSPDSDGGQRYSRHFYYGDETDAQVSGTEADSYYDKEANLWLKV